MKKKFNLGLDVLEETNKWDKINEHPKSKLVQKLFGRIDRLGILEELNDDQKKLI